MLIAIFGNGAVQRQATEIYIVRTLGLLAVAFALMVTGGFLAFVAWWLRTWRNERLRPALVFPSGHVP